MLIALKYNEDDYFNNEFYAKVGGVKKKEIDKLEYEFLIRSEYKLFAAFLGGGNAASLVFCSENYWFLYFYHNPDVWNQLFVGKPQ